MEHVCRCFESTTHYRLMIPSWELKTRTMTRATNLARHEVASSTQELLTLLSEGPPGNLGAWWRFWNPLDVGVGAIILCRRIMGVSHVHPFLFISSSTNSDGFWVSPRTRNIWWRRGSFQSVMEWCMFFRSEVLHLGSIELFVFSIHPAHKMRLFGWYWIVCRQYTIQVQTIDNTWAWLSIYRSICPSVYLSVCLSICLSIYLSIYLSTFIYQPD